MSAIGEVTPVLRIFDEALARAFYIDWLRFDIDFEHRFGDGMPLYMAVSRGDCTLHLSELHGDACPGSAVRIACRDVDTLLTELRGRRYKGLRPKVEAMPWGTRDMALLDPFGNRLVFTTQPED